MPNSVEQTRISVANPPKLPLPSGQAETSRSQIKALAQTQTSFELFQPSMGGRKIVGMLYYQDWNSRSDEKICGRMKFRRDQSSRKLFWSGVPVSSRTLSAGICLSSRNNRQSKFFSLWPCIIIRYNTTKRIIQLGIKSQIAHLGALKQMFPIMPTALYWSTNAAIPLVIKSLKLQHVLSNFFTLQKWNLNQRSDQKKTWQKHC